MNSGERLKKRRNYRMLMVGAVGASYLVDMGVLYGFAAAGTIDMQVPAVYGGLGLGHVVLFLLLHYSGFSERFENSHLIV